METDFEKKRTERKFISCIRTEQLKFTGCKTTESIENMFDFKFLTSAPYSFGNR